MSTVTLTTNHGVITISLDSAKAPKSAANFEQYVRDGHFAGTVFHRVIPSFMIQGGGFDTAGKQKSVRAAIDNEADNGLKNNKYTLAMARTNDPHSATAQFFINTADNEFLNHKSPSASGWGYAVFGEVTGGRDIVDKIGTVKTARNGFHDDWPVEAVEILSATIA
jgi:peptidyl-prolyl cis-trans isomerase B (cyclophilin B)